MTETLNEIYINNTLASSNTSLLSVPKLFLELGLYKLVYRLEIETFTEDIRVYGEAATYFKMVRTPLVPVIIEGSATKVSRGWNQLVVMNPELFSLDPDAPDERTFGYNWFCRVASPTMENYTKIDAETGFPAYVGSKQLIPAPSEAQPQNTPPGCFGKGIL